MAGEVLVAWRGGAPGSARHVSGGWVGKGCARERDVLALIPALAWSSQGIISTWKQAAPIVRTTIHGALEHIVMNNDVE